MEIHEIFGELDDKGQVKRKVNFTAEPEGMRVESGDVMVGIEGTNYFYYVKAGVFSKLNKESREAIESRVRGSVAPVAPSSVTGAIPIEAPAAPPNRAAKPDSKKEVTNDSSN